MNIEVKTVGLDKLARRYSNAPQIMNEEIRLGLLRTLDQIELKVKRRIPSKTSRLKGSFGGATGWKWVRGRVASIGTSVSYSRYVDEGTRPHIIRPRTKKALYWKGASHPVKSVNHPGTKPYEYIKKGVADASGNIMKIWEETVNKIGKRLSN